MKRKWTYTLLLSAVMLAGISGAAAETVAYLGVATQRLSPLTETGDLDSGIGLAVVDVDRQGPAGRVLREGDILYKLDDQWLVDPMQLRVLVHRLQAGDDVSLAFIRNGERREEVVRLGETEIATAHGPSPRTWPRMHLGEPSFPDLHRDWQDTLEQLRDQMREMEQRMGDMDEWLQWRSPRPDIPGEEARITSQRRIHAITKADGTQIRIEESNGDRSLIVTDADGEVLFDGQVNTDEQIEAVPEEFRDYINRLPETRPRPRLIPRDAL